MTAGRPRLRRHPKRWKPSIINIKRHKPPHYKDGTKIRPLHIERLEGNGDFRSPECVELLDEADIVVTNPPFSLFREYIAQLMEHDKKFVVIGNQNAVTYKEVFPLIKENRIWLGCYSGNMEFRVPGDYEAHSENDKRFWTDESGQNWRSIGTASWFTNLDIRKRHDELILVKRYKPEDYPKYDNYDAINVICLMEESRRLREARSYSSKSVRRILR